MSMHMTTPFFRALAGALLLVTTTSVIAADTTEASSAETSGRAAAQTDIIGNKETPGVFNVVPWKEKNAAPKKREVSTSILRETLQPLDRDVLRREIEFHRRAKRP